MKNGRKIINATEPKNKHLKELHKITEKIWE